MKTVQTVLQQLTDPKTVMADLCETLRIIDPKFFDTEGKYLAAASNLEKELGGSITPSASEFLAAKEQEFTAEIIYIGWQGFQLNSDIFNSPINALMLRGDYEELHCERHLGTLPMASKSRETINAFYEVMREKNRDKMDLTDDHLAGLEYVLSILEYREKDMLLQRYRDGIMRTEIAQSHGIMPERVRQIENKACSKLCPLAKRNYIAYGAAGTTKPYASDEVLIKCLNQSTRAHSYLQLAQCKRIGDIVRLTDETISTMRRLGKVRANDIAQAIKALTIQHFAWDKYLL